MKRSRILLTGLGLAVLVGLAVAARFGLGTTPDDDAAAETPTPSRTAFRPADRTRAAQRAARYLTTNGDARGRFLYLINLDPNVRVPDRYNILRHAGSIYALAHFERRHPDPTVRARLLHATSFLTNECVQPIPEEPELLAVWSTPENSSVATAQCKLGGTGLGLVALLSIEELVPGTTSLEDLRALGRFVEWMQKPDGSFHSKFLPENGGRNDDWESLYYPGEAALGLAMLAEHDDAEASRWRDVAVRALAYLAERRKDAQRVEPDHWALLATAKLFESAELDRELHWSLLQHAIQICDGILVERHAWPDDVPIHGCFTADGRTCPTATRLEGLLAALRFLPDSEAARRAEIREAVEEGLDFLARSQIESTLLAGAVPRAVVRLDPRHPGFSSSFNRRSTEIRVDYVQHALSAWLAHEDLSEAGLLADRDAETATVAKTAADEAGAVR